MASNQLSFAALALALVTLPCAAQEVPSDYRRATEQLGRPNDFKDGVLRISVPRNDIEVSVAGIATPTPFGFGGWIAMTKADGGHSVMMGDLVLLQEEVNPVMSAVLSSGLHVTALHNHFFWDEPRMFYMHVHGHGPAEELARKIKPALDLIGGAKVPSTASGRELRGPLDTKKLASIIGHAGETSGAVFKITIGRGDLSVKEMGATINARMGFNTWAAFYGSNDEAIVAGDVAMLEAEVTPVLKALRQHGLDIVALHHHMTGSRPVIIFLHYWGRGPAEKLAAGVRAALDQTGHRAP